MPVQMYDIQLPWDIPYKCMIYLGHFGAGDIEVKPRVSWVVPMLHIGRPIAICLGIPNRFDHVYAGG